MCCSELQAAVFDLLQDLLIAHGLAVVIALQPAAAGFAQKVHCFLRLHALRECEHVKLNGEIDDAGNDLARVFVVVKVPVYVNDNPEDVKDRGSEISNALLNKLKSDNMNINLLRTAGSGYLSSNKFTRLHEIEFNSNKAFMLEVL